jgi:hypothetical protein
MKKLLFGLAPLLAVAAFAVVPSAAMAGVEPCRVLTAGLASPGVEGKTCNNPPGMTAPQNLRDDADGAGTTPNSTKFGMDGLAVNTKGALRFRASVSGTVVNNENPIGYAFFGVKLDKNELSSKTVCRKATGWVTSVDIQHATPSAVFSGTAPTPSGFGPWTLTINSNSTACAEPGKVTVGNVSLLFETLVPITKGPVKATGSFTGKWEEPGANCPAGGVKLDISQPGITTEPASLTPEVDNGAGAAGFVCLVSANNYVFPATAAPTWGASTNQIWKD